MALPPVRRLAQVVMWLALATYLVALTVHGPRFNLIVDGWLAVAVQLLPAAVCWMSLADARGRRTEVLWLAIGVSGFAAGNVVLVTAQARDAVLPVPSLADVGYMSLYPSLLVAMSLAVRREHREERGAIWLDSALGGVAAAAAIAVLLKPAFAAHHRGALSATVSLSYPVGDLLLVFAVVAVASLNRWRLDRRWLPLLAGFAVFACTDVIYDMQIAANSYVVGTPLDAFWPVGLTLMTLWVSQPAQEQPLRAQRPVVLAVPAAAAAVSLGVLVFGTITRIAPVAIGLAALSMAGSVVRTQLAFRQQQRLTDLRREARTDDLTGLPNRRAFYDRVRAELGGGPAALLLLDLDKFKEVNDSLGHHVGDELLVDVARRLSAPGVAGTKLARLGGDEFALLIPNASRSAAEATAERIQTALAAPFVYGDIMLVTSASIGISLAPEHGDELSLLLRRADIAMYDAKQDRAGHRVFVADSLNSGDHEHRLRTLQELRDALATGQLILHYQPKLELRTDVIVGVEALVRWNHPTRGLLYPDAFLQLVEQAGLMPALTEVVLTIALDQARTWHSAGRTMTVAVNLSASSLVDVNLPDKIAAHVSSRHLPMNALQLEITEEVLMKDRERAAQILRRLREIGVQISVDDFGTGYSSLAYLRELPIDELKLDRSFVAPMSTDPRATALVISTIALAHSLGLRMVAEGVEDAAALDQLRDSGCDQAQGYLLCRPVSATDLERWLSDRPLSARLPDDEAVARASPAPPGEPTGSRPVASPLLRPTHPEMPEPSGW